MPPSSPQVDEHGFPIPPTFDDSQNGRRKLGAPLRRFWLIGLMLVFMALLASAVLESGGWDKAKEWMADFLVQRAQKKQVLDDLPGALEDLERAARWVPDDPPIYELRAEIKKQLKDLEGSLRDYNKLVELRPRYAQAYMHRSVVLQRLKRHREAIDDLTQAMKLSTAERATLPKNNRAYARAIAGVELEEAFKDIEEAIAEDADRHDTRDHLDHPNAAYLDTRGYLHLLLGRPEQALADFDLAIKITEQEREALLVKFEQFNASKKIRDFYGKPVIENLAVMYHHRGQAHEKLGHTSEAESDLKKGDSLGYNPDEGVF